MEAAAGGIKALHEMRRFHFIPIAGTLMHIPSRGVVNSSNDHQIENHWKLGYVGFTVKRQDLLVNEYAGADLRLLEVRIASEMICIN